MMNSHEPFSGITIVGLGPGDPALLTRQAWEWIQTTPSLILRTRQHPVVAGFPKSLLVESFDELYENGGPLEQIHAAIVEKVLELGNQPNGVTYAVPGHPFVADATTPEIVRRAKEQDLPVRVFEGLSFFEPTFMALGIDPFPNTVLVDALAVGAAHVPPFAPSAPALICQIYSVDIAAQVKRVLMAVYPGEHRVAYVHGAGTAAERVEDLPLEAIDRSPHVGLQTTLYLPALGADTSFEAFQELVAHLRAPEGCPWDQKQTHLSLRIHLLEETYETLEALDQQDAAGMAEEFGDLLLQIVLHAQIAGETGEFRMADVIQGIHRKIVRRHPHVFGDAQVAGVSGVLSNWEKLKAAEREANGTSSTKGLLDGVPRSLPALTQAQEIQDRAARVGFDWPAIDGVLAKVIEEVEEIRAAQTPQELADEIGDLLFAVVNVARWQKVDAESALRSTNSRFRARFGYIERKAAEQGKATSDLTFEQMDELWEAAKREEQ